jgi:hypothetical protein
MEAVRDKQAKRAASGALFAIRIFRPGGKG